MLNFLPYPKGNRDEWIAKSELDRISGPFSQIECSKDPEDIKKSLKALNDYFTNKIQGQSAAKPKEDTKNDKKADKKQSQQPQAAAKKEKAPAQQPDKKQGKKEETTESKPVLSFGPLGALGGNQTQQEEKESSPKQQSKFF